MLKIFVFLFDNLLLMGLVVMVSFVWLVVLFSCVVVLFIWLVWFPNTSSIPLHLCDTIRAVVIVLLLNGIYTQHKSTKLTNYVLLALGNSTDMNLVTI